MVAMALAIACLAFVFRFNALGGALAGFDNEEFNKLTRVNLILAGEQPIRDFNDGELRGIRPSLTYELPAWAQRRWGRNLLTHGVLTCGILAGCAAMVLLLARVLSRSLVVGLLAALAVMTSVPKLYNYPKVLTLTVAMAAVYWAISRPTIARLAVLAAWTVAAVLFRHDLGVYVAVATSAGLIACERRPWRVPARRLATYGVLTVLFSLPSVVWVAYYAGILPYLSDTLFAVGAEGRRLQAWPLIDLADPLSAPGLVALNYYAFWAIPVFGILLIALYTWRRVPLPRRFVAMGVALATTTLVTNFFFLRSNLPARFGDAMVPVALVAAWLAGAVPEGSPRRQRAFAQAGVALVLLALCAAFVPMNQIVHELGTGGLSDSGSVVLSKFRDVAVSLRAEPPVTWTEKPVVRTIAVSRYLAECTAPEDRVLLATFADEVAYFARRQFAGGQRRFTSNVLTSESDQRQVLERLARQSVPVVVTDPNYDPEFTTDYPLVARHIEAHYREVGVVTDGVTPILHVWVEKTRRPVRTDPVLGFPCFQ
jgi:hypothetical protein